MKRVLAIFITTTTFLYAAYNPFFSDDSAPKQKQQASRTTVQEKPTPTRQNAQIGYFGFIESKKGKFALINFSGKNIVIREEDSLYLDEQIFKVLKITSNYILLNDRYSRAQTVYFSSEKQENQR
jgi:hypothetical protein